MYYSFIAKYQRPNSWMYKHGSRSLCQCRARKPGPLHRQRPGLENRVCPIGWDWNTCLAFPLESHSSKEEHYPPPPPPSPPHAPDGVGLGAFWTGEWTTKDPLRQRGVQGAGAGAHSHSVGMDFAGRYMNYPESRQLYASAHTIGEL